MSSTSESGTTLRSIQKCEHCGSWTDGQKTFCQHCGEMLDLAHRKERWELEKKWAEWFAFMKYVKIKGSNNNLFLLFIEKLIQTGQFILTIIILSVTLILFFLPG